jgi:anti-sigma B factor antagonist
VLQSNGADVAQTPLAALVQLERGDQVSEQEKRPADDGSSLRKDPVLSVETVGHAGVVVKLGGELDLYNSPQVREALLEACKDAPGRVIVDLGEVEFIDSTALGVLIEARAKLGNRSRFLLAAPGLETRRALQISGLDRHFAVHDTVPAALEASV